MFLNQFEEWFRWALTDPRGISEALKGESLRPMATFPRRKEPVPRFFHSVRSGGDLTASDRLSVYSNAYFERLKETLAADFPAVRRVLGETNFRQLAADYLFRFPSRSTCIEEVGEQLSNFLKNHRLSQRFAFLSELALLEWNVLECVYTTRGPTVNTSMLQGLNADSWGMATFTIDPTVKLQQTFYPLPRLWKLRYKQGKSPIRWSAEKKITWLLVSRQDGWAQVSSLSREEWTALKKLKEGTSLGSLCGELERLGVRPDQIQSWFATWIRQGLINQVNINSSGRKNLS